MSDAVDHDPDSNEGEITVFPASSHLAEMRYVEQVEDLFITFRDGSVYLYRNVPRQTVRQLGLASSPGAYLNRQKMFGERVGG